VASTGIDAVRAIGADRRALEAGFPTPGITLRSTTGKHLGVARTGLSLPDGTPSHTLKRADLHQAIHDQAASGGIAVEHGKRPVDVVEPPGDGDRALFDDGSDATGEVLVGADGIDLVARRRIDPNAPAPTYAGLINLGGYARGVHVDTEPGSYTMILDRRAFFGYALAPDGEVWWFANLPHRDEPARGEVEAITAQAWRRRLAEPYAQDAGPAIQLVQASDPANIIRAGPPPLHPAPAEVAGRQLAGG
jgi:FAD-dependent urate hydroxylase